MPKPIPKPKSDAADIIDFVQKETNRRGERMTNVRRDVLTALSRFSEPQSANQIRAEVNKKRTLKLSAMSLYRTLDFLMELGVVIKLESQNVYKLCLEHQCDHSHLVMICDHCGDSREIKDLPTSKKLQDLTRKYGHFLKHHVIELHGSCANCHP